MENLDLNQGVLCEIENTEYGTVVTFPADLNLQALTEPLHLFESNETYREDPVEECGRVADVRNKDGVLSRQIEAAACLQGSSNDICTRDGSIIAENNIDADETSSFPELGSIIELETDTCHVDEDDGQCFPREKGQQKYNYLQHDNLPKKWDAKKTLALIKAIRKHQYHFKTSSIQRITVWNEISEELCKKGFHECNRDECRKKWDNLYRTFRKISQRVSEKVTWELYEPVKETVKCLSWENFGSIKRKRRYSSELSAAHKILKLNEEFHESITQKHISFFTKVDILEKEKKTILSKIKKLMSNL